MSAWKSVGKQYLLGIGSENKSLKFIETLPSPTTQNLVFLVYMCDCLQRNYQNDREK